MMLIFQIGLGILLGFLLIQYRHHLTKVVVVVAVAAGAALIGATLMYAWSEVTSSPAVESFATRTWAKLGTLAVVLPCLILGVASGVPLSHLFHQVFRRQPVVATEAEPAADVKPQSDDAALWWLFKWAFANFILTTTVYYAAAAVTPVGNIGNAIDAYSRANGWNDGLSVVSFVALLQWTWVAWWIVTKVKRVRESKA